MRDARVSEVPGKVGADLVAVVSSNSLVGHGSRWRTSAMQAIALGIELPTSRDRSCWIYACPGSERRLLRAKRS